MDDEREEDARFDEEVRQRLWDAFIRDVLNFQESENWSGVLAAVARAMRDREDGRA